MLFANLPILPIAIPLLTAGLMLLFNEQQRRAKTILGLMSFASLIRVSLLLIQLTDGAMSSDWVNKVRVYLLGHWPAPSSTVIVVDRMAALMRILSSGLSTCTRLCGSA